MMQRRRMWERDHVNILKNGSFYYPASAHYGYRANVICDRCRKDNLISCVGYDDADLCMTCTQTILDFADKVPVGPIESIVGYSNGPPADFVVQEQELSAEIEKCKEEMKDRKIEEDTLKKIAFQRIVKEIFPVLHYPGQQRHVTRPTLPNYPNRSVLEGLVVSV